MPAETITQAQEAAEFLAKATDSADWAATHLTDVVSLCEEPDGESVPLVEALALLGRACMAKESIEWSLDEVEKTIRSLIQQVHLAEEQEQFARIDAERRGDDA